MFCFFGVGPIKRSWKYYYCFCALATWVESCVVTQSFLGKLIIIFLSASHKLRCTWVECSLLLLFCLFF